MTRLRTRPADGSLPAADRSPIDDRIPVSDRNAAADPPPVGGTVPAGDPLAVGDPFVIGAPLAVGDPIPRADAPLDVRVEIHGELPQVDVEYARRQAHTLLAQLAPGAYAARLRLTRARNRAVTRPVIAQAGLLLEGVGPVRVQLSAVTAREAVDLTLGTVLGRAARLREQGDIGLAVAYESAYRPQFAPRPLTERRIVRRKPVALAALTPEQAVREMLALDHHFHLFTDADTGQDSLVHRQPATGGFRLVRADSTACPDGSGLPLSESLHPAPRFDVTEAARRLWLTCWPFVFFVDAPAAPAAPGAHAPRGQVLYRRYDGHYGLITAV